MTLEEALAFTAKEAGARFASLGLDADTMMGENMADMNQVHIHEMDTDPSSEQVTPFNCPVCGTAWAIRKDDGNWIEIEEAI